MQSGKKWCKIAKINQPRSEEKFVYTASVIFWLPSLLNFFQAWYFVSSHIAVMFMQIRRNIPTEKSSALNSNTEDGLVPDMFSEISIFPFADNYLTFSRMIKLLFPSSNSSSPSLSLSLSLSLSSVSHLHIVEPFNLISLWEIVFMFPNSRIEMVFIFKF